MAANQTAKAGSPVPLSPPSPLWVFTQHVRPALFHCCVLAGKAGEKAAEQSEEAMAANLAAKAKRAAAEAEARAKSTLSNAHLEKGGIHGTVWGSEGAADAELDEEKVHAALKKLEQQERDAEAAAGDERKRKVCGCRVGVCGWVGVQMCVGGSGCRC